MYSKSQQSCTCCSIAVSSSKELRMIAWKTSELIAIYLAGFVILPGVILSASVDIQSTGPAASLCDPEAFPLCSCNEENTFVYCKFSKNSAITKVRCVNII